MRKLLMACVVLVIMVLGLTACARAADEAPAQNFAHFETEAMREAMGLSDFSLPLTGGSGWSLFSARRESEPAVPVPASAPGGYGAVVSDMDDSQAGQVDWEDLAESGERHVIQTADVVLHTEYFGEVETALRQLAPDVNGFVESAMSTNHGQRRFTIVLRVPVASFETVLRQIEGLAYVRTLNQWAQDVTDQFYDMTGSYNIRRLEEERILALIQEAETVHELLALEQRLSNTRLSIERYLSQLNHMAGQIAYSTITVTVIDVSEVPSDALVPTLGERIGGAFGDSVGGTVRAVQNVVVFMAGAIVPLVLIGIVAVAIYLVIRAKKKMKKINA